MLDFLNKIFHKTPETPAQTDPVATPQPLASLPNVALPPLMQSEPVVDSKGELMGTLFRLRHGQRQQQHALHFDTVLLESFRRLASTARTSRHWLVELGAGSLNLSTLDELAEREATLLLMPGQLPEHAEARLAELKEKGLRLALYLPGKWPAGVVKLAGAFAFPVHGRTPEQAAELVQRLKGISPRAAIIAVDIAWREEYAWAKRIGCHFAAGQLFNAQYWPDEPLDPGFIRVLDLLNMIRREADNADIVRALKTDALLSLRLLKQVNSAAMGLTSRIDSIEQAIVVLGRSQFYRWLTLLIYAHPGVVENSPALQEMAQIRGELMMRMGREHLPGQAENLYLTGLFSLLDALLQRPLTRILTDVDLASPVRLALLADTGPFAPYLRLAKAAELPEAPSAAQLAACNLDEAVFNNMLIDALVAVEKLEVKDAG
jgi:EAL and modified HD-GYP domain-containing signal transduction protein